MLVAPSANAQETIRLGPGSSRTWRVPPALLRNPSAPEALEGERILHEFPSDTGLLLWLCYRDVRLWVGTPPELRGELFHRAGSPQQRELIEAARLNAETLRAVRRLYAALGMSRDDGSMAAAGLAIAAAADRAHAAATAMAYTQLASAVAPTAAGPALAVGLLASRFGHAAMAETWLRRAIGLARRSREWTVYGGALIELGRIRERLGRLRDAHTEYRKALRLARHCGLYETQGRALSGLLRVALYEADQAATGRYAKSALRFHRREHPDRGSVLLDVAEAELRRGGYIRAVALLREALPMQTDTQDEVRALTMQVRASGGVDDRAAVEEAWHRTLALIEVFGPCADGVRLLLTLARAGAEVMEEANADVVAHRALAWSARLGQAALVDECKAFLARPRFPASGGRE
jgi:tetratricopeptide (TPR) repeat protein